MKHHKRKLSPKAKDRIGDGIAIVVFSIIVGLIIWGGTAFWDAQQRQLVKDRAQDKVEADERYYAAIDRCKLVAEDLNSESKFDTTLGCRIKVNGVFLPEDVAYERLANGETSEEQSKVS